MPNKLPTSLTVSEARLNDICYMILKRYFFESWGYAPRECDIRVCMQLGHPPMLAGVGLEAAILRPDEVAPKSHSRMYTINPQAVFDACIEYMEDHWMKQKVNKSFLRDARKDFVALLEDLMRVPEEECAVTVPKLAAEGDATQ